MRHCQHCGNVEITGRTKFCDKCKLRRASDAKKEAERFEIQEFDSPIRMDKLLSIAINEAR